MNTVYKNILMGLLIIGIILAGTFGIYTFGKDVGYTKRSNEILEEQAELRKERDKFMTELELFKIASKRALEDKIDNAEKAYLDGVEYGKAQVDIAIDDLSDSGLSVNVTTDSSSGSCDSRSSKNTTSTTETTRAKLSKEDAAFLIAFSNEADDTARQLKACQVTVVEMKNYIDTWISRKF